MFSSLEHVGAKKSCFFWENKLFVGLDCFSALGCQNKWFSMRNKRSTFEFKNMVPASTLEVGLTCELPLEPRMGYGALCSMVRTIQSLVTA